MTERPPLPQEAAEALHDLDAYCRRIGYTGPREPTLDVLHALMEAHSQTIPFENLDPLLGRPVRLDVASLERKLVQEGRGGYCFEQNGLFLAVLQSLGFQVVPLSARVRIGWPRDIVTPRTHMCLRVEIDEQAYLADVGVGGLSLTAALLFQLDTQQPTPHETRRIVCEQGVHYHQVLFSEEWQDVYELTLEEMPRIDREVGNWYTSTHPESRFKNVLMVARAAPGGKRLTILNDEFSVREANGQATKTPLTSKQQLLAIMAEQFGITLPSDAPLHVPGIAWLAAD
ncbi:arylamine N-acetyltransferase [Bremerella cremea]|uniref:Arylamine N-acetyltransferase n=1 Tax=Bremerella cremea TaxID=1031537 RepID=A0A368KQ07_9BACT|nr:arylamine N-acetyltransferase [Bremerella cremea]RCS43254.1 arylamine N-acetyltransferase [Bremerella cremea]